MLETKRRPKTVVYPESDGLPMAETDTHRDLMVQALIEPLKTFYHGRDDIYISGNLLLYYEEGQPRKSISPDVFVVFGIPAGQRRIYKLWEEGRAPDVVFELTSKATYRQDLETKRFLYEQLGVSEYFLFDPLREYLQPPLHGFRLQNGFYVPLSPRPLPENNWALFSQQLQLELHSHGESLRLYNPATESYLLTTQEEAQARLHAEWLAEREANARREAEVKVQEMEAEIARLRALLAARNGGGNA
jgi:Uma2 family endonuclease